MALTNLNGVEEVNIFKKDGNVIHISAPKSNIIYISIVLCQIAYNQYLLIVFDSSSIYTFQHLRN